jgi:hypothetical protein
MSRELTAITGKVLAEDKDFCQYLVAARIKPGNRGGTFIGHHSKAPASFSRYGIVLPRGGMILPQIEPEALSALLGRPVPTRVRAEEAYRMDPDVEYVFEPEEPLPYR